MAEVTDTLSKGHSVLIFPEGTRSLDGNLKPFKSGIYHIAKQSGSPLIPIYLNNLSKLLPKGEAIPIPVIATLTLGEPLHLTKMQDKKQFLENARNQLINLSPN